ncbi:MAG: OmpA family protein [Ignavibacteriae bacterium]|nr:OmpA family protein [Ignavibacteriota bacterium]
MSTYVRNSISIILAAAVLLMGCSASKTVKGGAIGAGAGAVIGGIIGHEAGNTAVGAIIGAAVGGTAGALIGRYMDKQAEEMRRDIKNAKIERVGEGIKITFDSGLLFRTNSARLSPAAETNIRELARILQKYDDTDILVEGHTDSVGADSYNQDLSEERADAVSNFAKGLGVKGARFTTVGYGETQPVTSNSSAEGRQKNRRVEIAIMANDDLKDAAEENKQILPG